MWVQIEAERILYVDRGRDTILCDRGHAGPVTLVLKIEDRKMLKVPCKVTAEPCDKRIAKVRKAIDREEKYLLRTLHSRSAGGVMAGDIEGAFHRLHTALDKAQ